MSTRAAERLEVRPGAVLAGRFQPPGDKSVTHRAYVLGLLSEGAIVENPNPGTDCAATLACAQALGLQVQGGRDRLELRGRGFELVEPHGVLDCGNSGTTLRLMAGVLAAQPFLSILSGDASLNARPVDRVIEPLTRMGARLTARSGHRFPPLVIEGAALRGLHYRLPVASAQVASAILFAGLQADGETTIVIPGPARDHTERMLRSCGVKIEVEREDSGGRTVTLRGPVVPGKGWYKVPGDLSSAAFFMAGAAATGSQVTAEGVSLNETRTGLLDALEAMGARVERANPRVESGEAVGDVTVHGPQRLTALDLPVEWVPRMIDEIPAWTIAAAAAAGTSRVRGAGELRIKESDRIAALARNLGALGVIVNERDDGFEIVGGRVRGGHVDAAGDHRMAMTLAVLGTMADAPVVIGGAQAIETSYPGFAHTFSGLGGRLGGGDREHART